MKKHPYRKAPGFRYGTQDQLTGCFVVQSTYAPGLGFGPGYFPWAVTCITRRQTIYTDTLREAKEIAVRAADDTSDLKNWDWDFGKAGARGTPDYQVYAEVQP